MTRLNTTAPSRGKSYNPGPFLGALPLPSTDASAERWRMATRALVNPTPSTYAQCAPRPSHDVPLTERLFDALAAFKLKTAMLAAAHFNRDERARLFKQLDSLLDAESWDSADVVTTEASFTTLLRMVLFLGGAPAGSRSHWHRQLHRHVDRGQRSPHHRMQARRSCAVGSCAESRRPARECRGRNNGQALA